MFAGLSDINIHLPTDKLEIDDGSIAGYALEAERIIKAQLSGVFEITTIALWDEPDNTPETIRGIAGRLIAADYYDERYAVDSDVAPAYSKQKRDEAMGMLFGVAAGTIILPEVGGLDSAVQLTESDFWPNSTTGEPMFTVDMEFG